MVQIRLVAKKAANPRNRTWCNVNSPISQLPGSNCQERKMGRMISGESCDMTKRTALLHPTKSRTQRNQDGWTRANSRQDRKVHARVRKCDGYMAGLFSRAQNTQFACIMGSHADIPCFYQSDRNSWNSGSYRSNSISSGNVTLMPH